MNKEFPISNFQFSNYQRGQAMMTTIVLVMFAGLVLVLGVSGPVASEAKTARESSLSKKVFIVAEAGQEDVSFRVRQGMNYDATETLPLSGISAVTETSEDPSTGAISVITEGEGGGLVRAKNMELVRGDEINFNYGVQAGNGGLRLENQSLVRGNVYSNGTVVATQNNDIFGTVASAEAGGLIDGVHATGTARANTIVDSTIEGDAYYETISDSTVLGTLFPGSDDPPSAEFPISDTTLDEWEEAAAAGGVINSPCPYIINSDTTIGPIKINCDLEIRLGPTVTLAGMVWVNGNIDVKNNATIRLAESVSGNSVAMIADNPNDRTASSKIILRNSITFAGNSRPGTFVSMISRNRSAEDGGTVKAISFEQTAEGAVLIYSNHGKIYISNNSDLKEVTGYTIHLVNSAELIYEQGLENSIFDTGPGGSYEISSWREVE